MADILFAVQILSGWKTKQEFDEVFDKVPVMISDDSIDGSIVQFWKATPDVVGRKFRLVPEEVPEKKNQQW